jgi:signal transduction histidine kinase
MIWPWLHRHTWLTDVTLTAVLLVGGTVAASQADRSAVALLFTLTGTLPLLARRRFPYAAAAVTTASALGLIAVGAWVLPLALAVALYTLTSLREGTRARRAAFLAIASVGVAELFSGGVEFGAAAARVVLLVAVALLGDNVRSRRAYVREIEEKAARLEQERESEAQRAAAEEQARIARELHDVIAHALTVIVVQAGAADDAFEFDPRRAREPIREVDRAARAALADLRRALGVVDSAQQLAPQPSLGQLDTLVESVRATGLDVELEIDGQRKALPAAVDLSAYRIVQEALTNSLKHAAAHRIQVRVRYGDDLQLEVRDDGVGTGEASEGTGHGLVGMRERVSLLGGRFSAGPAAGGGYRVEAAIPLDA